MRITIYDIEGTRGARRGSVHGGSKRAEKKKNV